MVYFKILCGGGTMLSRSNAGLSRFFAGETGQKPNRAVLLPRIWVILSVLALPFMALCAHYFESLERSGTAGAIIADTMMPASIICYLILLCMLKQRKI
jgi:hypothetical protein